MSDYWSKRGELRQESLLRKADEFNENMEREYKSAVKSIENDISVFFQRFSDNEGLTMAQARKFYNSNELDDFRMTLGEYIKKGKENGVSADWIKELESASDLHRIDRLEALKIQMENQIENIVAYKLSGAEKTLSEIYEEGYYRSIYDVQHFAGKGSSFAILDERKIKEVLSKPWTYDGETFSDRIWSDKEKLKYSLEKTLTQGIIRGDSPDKITSALARETGVELSSTRRLVLTEGAAFASAAREDSYKELGIEKFEVVVSLDERTCDTCGDYDGKVFEQKEYAVGVTAPPYHPNCRCTTVPYFNDEFTKGETRTARDDDGKTYDVPADMTYKEWKEKYVDNATVIQSPAFIHIKNSDVITGNIAERLNREMDLIPDSHRNIIKLAVKEIELIETGNSRYNRKTGVLYLRTDFIKGELAHEFGHAIETELDLYHNEEFLKLVHKTVDNYCMADIIYDKDTFGEPVVYLKADNLISIYQGRLYEEVGIFDDDMNINIFSFAEYFAEGYNTYIYNNALLKEKDTGLYNFIKKIGATK